MKTITLQSSAASLTQSGLIVLLPRCHDQAAQLLHQEGREGQKENQGPKFRLHAPKFLIAELRLAAPQDVELDQVLRVRGLAQGYGDLVREEVLGHGISTVGRSQHDQRVDG